LRVLIFHGYLLAGTGSNVYTANLAAALVAAGHEVHLLAQERDPLAQEWVDAAGDWDGGELRVVARREPAGATVYRPDLGGLLPVYVADRYPGVQARPFPELTEREVDAYLAANVTAVEEVAQLARPDVALANHLVMGPVILARALGELGVPYAVKIHGSALEYTVKPHPRFLPYAREGLAGACGVLVGSRHTAESLWAALEDPGLPARTRLGPPGADTARFAPRDLEASRAGLEALVGRLGAGEDEPAGGAAHGGPDDGEGKGAAPASSSFARDPGAAAAALAGLDPGRDRIVAFVGKLIASKGVELALAALPLVAAAVPAVRFVVVGFGPLRPALEGFAAALGHGDLGAAAALRGEGGEPLPALAAFLASLSGADADHYRAAARGLPERIRWTGRLEHDELAELLPAAEALVVPSTFPEAFGMVAVEAAACGALPVVARHSGLAEVAAALAPALPAEVRPALTFPVGPTAVRDLAGGLERWLTASPPARATARDALAATTRGRFGWDAVARTVIRAARGDLDALPAP